MIKVYTDGACQPNPGKMGIGVVVEWQNKKPTIISEFAGEGTNNQAEYLALLRAMKLIRDETIMSATIHSDSNLMVRQVNKDWKCRDRELKKLLEVALSRMIWFKNNGFSIKLEYIPRELNPADTPAKNGVNKGG